MTSAVSRAHVITIPPDRLNPVVVHPGCRRVLAEVGLPSDELFLFSGGRGRCSQLPAGSLRKKVIKLAKKVEAVDPTASALPEKGWRE